MRYFCHTLSAAPFGCYAQKLKISQLTLIPKRQHHFGVELSQNYSTGTDLLSFREIFHQDRRVDCAEKLKNV